MAQEPTANQFHPSMGGVSSRTGRGAAEEVTRDYFKQSAHLRRLLGITSYETSVKLHKLWESVSVKPTQRRRLKALLAKMGVTPRDTQFCRDIIELMLGRPPVITEAGVVVKREVECVNETLEGFHGCFCYSVFVAWMWILASATQDTICRIAFRLYGNKLRVGYLATSEEVEALILKFAHEDKLYPTGPTTVHTRKIINSQFVIEPLLCHAEKSVDEERFVSLCRMLLTAPDMTRSVRRLQHRAQKYFGKSYWTPDVLSAAQSKLQKAEFRATMIHVLQSQCACATPAMSCGDGGLDHEDSPKSTIGRSSTSSNGQTASGDMDRKPSSRLILVRERAHHTPTAFATKHGYINPDTLQCLCVPTFQYLLDLGGPGFEARVDGAGFLLDPGQRTKFAGAVARHSA